jgi:hypothetical protein
VTYSDFIRQHPSYRLMPKVIRTADGKADVRLEHASVEDLSAYRETLSRRIERRERRMMRRAW